MNNLSDYFNKYGSDKCTEHTYQLIYNGLPWDRNASIDILESGVSRGASLMAWKDYFPNARVTGVDIVDNRLADNIRDDIEFVLSDIKDYKPKKKFDLIIEDGNHSNFDALWSGEHLSRFLKDGGHLIIEDVQEGFMVPFLLWGKLSGVYVVNALDMRRITNTHDNFVVIIQKLYEAINQEK